MDASELIQWLQNEIKVATEGYETWFEGDVEDEHRTPFMQLYTTRIKTLQEVLDKVRESQ